MQRVSTNPMGRWVELLQSRVSLLNQLARCREGCSARAPTGFELLSSCRARRLLTVFGARRHRVGYSSQGFRPGTCCRRAPAPIANPRTHPATRLLSPSLISPLGTSCSIAGWGMPSFDGVFPTHSHHPCSSISCTFVGGPNSVHLNVGWAGVFYGSQCSR